MIYHQLLLSTKIQHDGAGATRGSDTAYFSEHLSSPSVFTEIRVAQ